MTYTLANGDVLEAWCDTHRGPNTHDGYMTFLPGKRHYRLNGRVISEKRALTLSLNG